MSRSWIAVRRGKRCGFGRNRRASVHSSFCLRLCLLMAPVLPITNNKKLGTFSLLLVPMKTSDESASHFEAVINRLYP